MGLHHVSFLAQSMPPRMGRLTSVLLHHTMCRFGPRAYPREYRTFLSSKVQLCHEFASCAVVGLEDTLAHRQIDKFLVAPYFREHRAFLISKVQFCHDFAPCAVIGPEHAPTHRQIGKFSVASYHVPFLAQSMPS